jgi:hypothetical protein
MLIRIHNTAIMYSTEHLLVLTKLLVADHFQCELKYLLELRPQVFRHRLSNICPKVTADFLQTYRVGAPLKNLRLLKYKSILVMKSTKTD